MKEKTREKEIPGISPSNPSQIKIQPIIPMPGLNHISFRYSDAELEEFRSLINTRIEVAKKELRFLQDQMRGKEDRAEDDNKFSFEDGSASVELEQLALLAARQSQYIQNLSNALTRVSNKTYGVCRVTGKLIDKARLFLVPHATLSVEAKKFG